MPKKDSLQVRKEYRDYKELHEKLLIALVSSPNYTKDTTYDEIVEEASELANNFLSWHKYEEDAWLNEAQIKGVI